MTTAAATYLVADLFCGAGGSSTGAEKAISSIGGVMKLVAVNHWPLAVRTHQINHPRARHVVEDVTMADPEAIVPEGRLDLLMASPECKFYSRARGGKPIHDQGRMNPWAVFNWLTKLDVRRVLVENVPEFTEWGPLGEDGRPIKKRKREHFEAWFMTFLALGYRAEWRMLNSADYGDATTRTRFFLQARNDGRPIHWPEPSHARGDTGMFPGRKPWRGAREIINWDNLGRSLLDDPKYLKTPLRPKTRQRIARGLDKFGGPLAPLYIRLLDLEGPTEGSTNDGQITVQAFIINRHGDNGSARVHSLDYPLPTATCRGAGYLVEPGAEPVPEAASPFVGANRNNNAPRGTDEPIPPATTAHGGGSFLVEPEVQPFLLGQQSQAAPRSDEEPVPTVAAAGAISLVRPTIIQYYGQSHAQDTEKPLSAITRCNKHGLAYPTLVEVNHGAARSEGDEGRRTPDLDEPIASPTTKRGLGIANPAVIELAHGNGPQGDRGNDRRVHSVDEPLGAITTSPGLGLASPLLVQSSQTGGNGGYSRTTEQPLPTLTTKKDMNLIEPVAYIIPNFGERDGQQPRVHDIQEPAPAVTSRGAGSLVSPTMAEAVLERALEGGIDPRRLVFIDGYPYLLDIRFRMLENAELARAMGFNDEETEYEFVGNIGEVTKQIGNAVPVNTAAALVKAALDPGAEERELQTA